MSKLKQFRTVMDYFLFLRVRELALNLQFERSLPLIVVDIAVLLFFAWAELRWFMTRGESELERVAESRLQNRAGWLSSGGWIAFIALNQCDGWQRLRFRGSVLETVAQLPHQQLLVDGELAGLALVFGGTAIGLFELRYASSRRER